MITELTKVNSKMITKVNSMMITEVNNTVFIELTKVNSKMIEQVNSKMIIKVNSTMKLNNMMIIEVNGTTFTKVNRTRNLVMSPIMRASEICSVPRTSKAGIRYMVLAMLRTFATAKRMSEMISGSSAFQSNLAGMEVENSSL